MAGMENVVTARYVKELDEEQGKTHREVADILRQQHPGVNGLSERSVRRFCATNGIRRYDSRVTGVDVHNVVTSAIAEDQRLLRNRPTADSGPVRAFVSRNACAAT